ncbi:MAG: anti-sigma factor domain-containing protein [Clostridium sp.]|jgi:hypothetical protein|nr:anti-sigma factor domain-containing protein [Clostridium sp.]
MKFKGLIMDISQHTVTVLTRNNEFYKLKRKPTMYKSQEIEFKKSDIINLVYYMKRLSVAAACFALILTGMIFGDVIPAWNANNSDVFGYVSLDVNPSIEFEIDKEQKILGVSYLEGLADNIEEDLNLKGMEISEGLFKVIGYYNQKSILSDSKENYVLLAGAVNDKNKIVRKNIQEAEKKIINSLESYRNKVQEDFQRINMIVIESSSEHMKLSKENHISMGKYTIFTEINQIKDDISIEEFKELSLKDIIEEYMKLPKNHLDSEEEVESTPDVATTPENTPAPDTTIMPTEEVVSTPTPSATSTQMPTQTPTRTPTPSATPVATSIVTSTPSVTPTSLATPTPAVVMPPTPTPNAIPTIKPSSTPEPVATQRPRPTPSAAPTIRPSSTPEPSATQRPRPTPKPSDTPAPGGTQYPTSTPGVMPSATPGTGEPEEIGTGLRGEYYDNPDFTGLVATCIDSEINFDWANNLPHPDLKNDGSISIRWEGQIKPQHTEMYAFYINRGYGVRLWVNDIMVINEWTKDIWGMSSFGHIFLVGGQKYNIKLEYYEFNNYGNYGNIKLEWSSMNTPREVVPQSVLFPSEKSKESSGNEGGFKADFFNDMDFEDFREKMMESDNNFNWGIDYPYKSTFNNEIFSSKWTGEIQPLYSEEYTFYITYSSGAVLWVNGTMVINGWNDMWNATNTGKIYLEAGKKYDICLEYYKNMGSEEIKLEWSSPSMPRSVIPQS